jgi:SNF2 family DNA or RNA helicase
LAKGNTQIAITNYEQLPWLVERLGKKWPFNTYIADESTRLKSFRTRGGSVRARAVSKHAHAPGSRWINMTGTPTPNGVGDLWGQNWFVDKGKRLGKSHTAFEGRWFRQIPGNPFHQTELMPHSAVEIQELMADVSLVLRSEDFFDLPPIVRNTIMVELPPKARKLYDAMEEEFYINIDGKSIDAASAGSKSMKLRQLASGSVYHEDGKWSHVHEEKIDALKSVVSEACGMPVMVVYYFKSDLEKLTKAFPHGRVLDKKQETIDKWNMGKIPLLFVHPASAGHGLSLQYGSNIMAFFSVDFNSEYHDQVIERLGPMRQYQAGLNRKVWCHYILAEDTVDKHVFDVVTGKATLQEAFKQALIDFRAKKMV